MRYKETAVYERLGYYYRFLGDTYDENGYKHLPCQNYQMAFWRLLESKPPLIYRLLSKYLYCKDIPINEQKFWDCKGDDATQKLYKAELKYVGVAHVRRRPDF